MFLSFRDSIKFQSHLLKFHNSPSTTHKSPFTTHLPQLTNHNSQLTLHPSPFTTHTYSLILQNNFLVSFMAKTVLKIDDEDQFDFILIGIVCHHKDYRLCHE